MEIYIKSEPSTSYENHFVVDNNNSDTKRIEKLEKIDTIISGHARTLNRYTQRDRIAVRSEITRVRDSNISVTAGVEIETILINDDDNCDSIKNATSSEQSQHASRCLLDQIEYDDEQFQKTKRIALPEDICQTKFIHIFTQSVLKSIVNELSVEKQIAVDAIVDESIPEPSVTSIMLSTSDKNIMVDVLELGRKVIALKPLFVNPKIVKVFYNTKSHLRLKYLEKLSLCLVNIFDITVASMELGNKPEELFLCLMLYGGGIAREIKPCNVNNRPLNQPKKLKLASSTHYLLYLYHILKNKLLEVSEDFYRKYLATCLELCRENYSLEEETTSSNIQVPNVIDISDDDEELAEIEVQTVIDNIQTTSDKTSDVVNSELDDAGSSMRQETMTSDDLSEAARSNIQATSSTIQATSSNIQATSSNIPDFIQNTTSTIRENRSNIHPYQHLIDDITYFPRQFVLSLDNETPKCLAETEFSVVAHRRALIRLVRRLHLVSEIGVDLLVTEINNRPSVVAILLSTTREDVIVDVLKLGTRITRLNKIFIDHRIVKIFFDSRIKNYIKFLQSIRLYPINIFDINMAVKATGLKFTTLARCLKYYGVNYLNCEENLCLRLPLHRNNQDFHRLQTHFLLHMYEEVKGGLLGVSHSVYQKMLDECLNLCREVYTSENLVSPFNNADEFNLETIAAQYNVEYDSKDHIILTIPLLAFESASPDSSYYQSDFEISPESNEILVGYSPGHQDISQSLNNFLFKSEGNQTIDDTNEVITKKSIPEITKIESDSSNMEMIVDTFNDLEIIQTKSDRRFCDNTTRSTNNTFSIETTDGFNRSVSENYEINATNVSNKSVSGNYNETSPTLPHYNSEIVCEIDRIILDNSENIEDTSEICRIVVDNNEISENVIEINRTVPDNNEVSEDVIEMTQTVPDNNEVSEDVIEMTRTVPDNNEMVDVAGEISLSIQDNNDEETSDDDDDVIFIKAPTPEIITIEDDFELDSSNLDGVSTSSTSVLNSIENIVKSHPYQIAHNNITYYKRQFEAIEYPLPKPVFDKRISNIRTMNELQHLISQLNCEPEIAIDVFVNNTDVSVIMISTQTRDIFVDIMSLDTSQLFCLNRVFSNMNVVKVFFGNSAKNRLKILQSLSLYFVNIFDISIAWEALGYQRESLSECLLRYNEDLSKVDKLTHSKSLSETSYKLRTHYLLHRYHQLKNELLSVSLELYRKVLKDCHLLCYKIYTPAELKEKKGQDEFYPIKRKGRDMENAGGNLGSVATCETRSSSGRKRGNRDEVIQVNKSNDAGNAGNCEAIRATVSKQLRSDQADSLMSSEETPHPHQHLLDNLIYTNEQFQVPTNETKPTSLSDTHLLQISTQHSLNCLVERLGVETEIAVDLVIDPGTCAPQVNSILLSTKTEDILIDVVALGNAVTALNNIFLNPGILKVFFDVNSQQVLKFLQVLLLFPVNIFDIIMASKGIGWMFTSLDGFLSEFYSIEEITCPFVELLQRPLVNRAQLFCKSRTHYLLYLYQNVKKESLRKSPTKYIQNLDTMNELCRKVYTVEEPYLREKEDMIKTLKEVQQVQRAFLEKLIQWRLNVAKSSKLPPSSVLNQTSIMAMVLDMPLKECEIAAYFKTQPAIANMHEIKQFAKVNLPGDRFIELVSKKRLRYNQLPVDLQRPDPIEAFQKLKEPGAEAPVKLKKKKKKKKRKTFVEISIPEPGNSRRQEEHQRLNSSAESKRAANENLQDAPKAKRPKETCTLAENIPKTLTLQQLDANLAQKLQDSPAYYLKVTPAQNLLASPAQNLQVGSVQQLPSVETACASSGYFNPNFFYHQNVQPSSSYIQTVQSSNIGYSFLQEHILTSSAANYQGFKNLDQSPPTSSRMGLQVHSLDEREQQNPPPVEVNINPPLELLRPDNSSDKEASHSENYSAKNEKNVEEEDSSSLYKFNSYMEDLEAEMWMDPADFDVSRIRRKM